MILRLKLVQTISYNDHTKLIKKLIVRQLQTQLNEKYYRLTVIIGYFNPHYLYFIENIQ